MICELFSAAIACILAGILVDCAGVVWTSRPETIGQLHRIHNMVTYCVPCIDIHPQMLRAVHVMTQAKSTGLDIAGSATSRDATPRRWKEGASVKSELHSSLVASPLDNVDGDAEPSLVAATTLLWSLMDIADIAWLSSFTTVSLSSLWSGEASLSSLSIKLHGINSVVEVWLSLKVRLLVLTNSISEVLVLVEELVVVRVVVIVVTELVELELVDSVVVSLTVLVLVLLVVLVVEVSVVEVTVWVVELLVKVHDWDVVVETDTEVDVVEVAWVCGVSHCYICTREKYVHTMHITKIECWICMHRDKSHTLSFVEFRYRLLYFSWHTFRLFRWLYHCHHLVLQQWQINSKYTSAIVFPLPTFSFSCRNWNC